MLTVSSCFLFSLSVKVLDHKFFSVIIKFQLFFSISVILNTVLTFGRPFVKRFALCYPTVVLSVCPISLCVTLVYCGQTVGCIKMKLGT